MSLSRLDGRLGAVSSVCFATTARVTACWSLGLKQLPWLCHNRRCGGHSVQWFVERRHRPRRSCLFPLRSNTTEAHVITTDAQHTSLYLEDFDNKSSFIAQVSPFASSGPLPPLSLGRFQTKPLKKGAALMNAFSAASAAANEHNVASKLPGSMPACGSSIIWSPFKAIALN